MAFTTLASATQRPRSLPLPLLTYLAPLALIFASSCGLAESYDTCVSRYIAQSYTPQKAHSKCKSCLNELPAPAAGKNGSKGRKQKKTGKDR